jgi:hypothetical protein
MREYDLMLSREERLGREVGCVVSRGPVGRIAVDYLLVTHYTSSRYSKTRSASTTTACSRTI